MTDLPAPLTPADCDLRGLPFMPLDVIRVLDSDLFALSTGEEFKCAIALWCKSWLQLPAASLPNDDRILAHLSGAGAKWKRVKSMALRGFVLCSDGRFYHPVVSEKAIEAWGKRGEWKEKQSGKTERQQRWRERQKELSRLLRDKGITPPVGASMSTLERLLVDGNASTPPSTVDARETPLTGTGTYTVSNDTDGDAENRSGDEQAPEPPKASPKVPPEPVLDPNRALWLDGVALLGERARPQIAKWIAAHGAEAVTEAFDRARIAKPERPAGYIQSILSRLSQEAKQRADEQARADALFDARYPPQQLTEFEAKALMSPEEFERWKQRGAA